MEIRSYPVINNKWVTNISDSVNKQHSTSFKAKVAKDGKLLVVNEADIEMAGGLVSTNVDVPAGFSHFGMEIGLFISPEDFPHLARCENDLKITFPGGLQANGSLQWNADKNIWQVGANDGSGWIDTPYTTPIKVGENLIQLRVKFDGKIWGFEGLRVNWDTNPWVPGNSFRNFVAPQSGWTPGLHPQLQTECKDAPWYLEEVFDVITVVAGTDVIPYSY